MKYYVGLDVALRSLALCIIDADGKIALERSLLCEIDDVAECIRSFGKPVEMIGFEACPAPIT